MSLYDEYLKESGKAKETEKTETLLKKEESEYSQGKIEKEKILSPNKEKEEERTVKKFEKKGAEEDKKTVIEIGEIEKKDFLPPVLSLPPKPSLSEKFLIRFLIFVLLILIILIFTFLFYWFFIFDDRNI